MNGCVQEVSQWQLCARAKEGTSDSEGTPREQKLCLQMPGSACTVERGLCNPGPYEEPRFGERVGGDMRGSIKQVSGHPASKLVVYLNAPQRWRKPEELLESKITLLPKVFPVSLSANGVLEFSGC